jgi:folate-binding protein YgfZ
MRVYSTPHGRALRVLHLSTYLTGCKLLSAPLAPFGHPTAAPLCLYEFVVTMPTLAGYIRLAMTEQTIVETPRVRASYGDTAAEYAAVRENGAGLIDLSDRGRIALGGLEAVAFLNGLITNDMKTLVEDTWMPAVFPNVQGRLVASVRVIRLKDETGRNTCPRYLIDSEAVTHERVVSTLQRFTLAGDFRVTDITSQTGQFTVQGNRAIDVIRSLLGDAAAGLATNGATKTKWNESEVTVLRATHTGANGFDLIVDSTLAIELWRSLVEAGAKPVGSDALEVLRIEAGIPRYGIDMDESNVVIETNLDDAVSYTKGCYIGQEIIARIKYRGHVAKKLVGISLTEEAKVASGNAIKSADDKKIGRVTSATYSPWLKHTIALGYMKYDYLEAGTEVKVSSGENEVTGQVTELPFVRGS